VPRKAELGDRELIARLGAVFRDVGYEGATLAALSSATGLQKASLYHRYPAGKEQMAREVLLDAGTWIEDNILTPLRSDAPPPQRIATLVRRLDEFYSGGRQACLLNMLSSVQGAGSPFSGLIKQVFESWTKALSATLMDAGFDRKTSISRAERAMILLQGSLVCSRGLETTRPFREMLKSLPHELLEPV
jgi:AcrR family transcriptional regulator